MTPHQAVVQYQANLTLANNHQQQQHYQQKAAPHQQQIYHQQAASHPQQHYQQQAASNPQQHYQQAAPPQQYQQASFHFQQQQYQQCAPLPPQHQDIPTATQQQNLCVPQTSSVVQLGSPGSLYSSGAPSMYGAVTGAFPVQYTAGASTHQIFFPGCTEPTPSTALDHRNSAIFNSFQPNRGSVVQNKNPDPTRTMNMQ